MKFYLRVSFKKASYYWRNTQLWNSLEMRGWARFCDVALQSEQMTIRVGSSGVPAPRHRLQATHCGFPQISWVEIGPWPSNLHSGKHGPVKQLAHLGNVENPIISTHPYSNISLSFDSRVAIKIKCNAGRGQRGKKTWETPNEKGRRPVFRIISFSLLHVGM